LYKNINEKKIDSFSAKQTYKATRVYILK